MSNFTFDDSQNLKDRAEVAAKLRQLASYIENPSSAPVTSLEITEPVRVSEHAIAYTISVKEFAPRSV